MKKGELVDPDGSTYTPGEVMSTYFWRQLARTLQTKQRLPEQGDWIAQKWLPGTEYESA
jgi:hypothetical protein